METATAAPTGTAPTETNDLTPSSYAFLKLGYDPYRWQVEALEAIYARQRVALVAANGSGKTAVVVAASVLWFLDTFPKGRVVITSGVYRQVKYQLWKALEEQKRKYPDWTWTECMIRTPQGGFAIGFATDDAGRAEGWHGKDDIEGWDAAREDDNWEAAMEAIAESAEDATPLFMVLDECKSLKDPTFVAVARCAPQYRLYVSSPGASFGKFYRCFNVPREAKHYYKIRATSAECPHIDPALIEQDRDELDEADFKSIHMAEFVDDGSAILSPQDMQKALDNQPTIDTTGERVGFCDFARGGDENVFAIREGNRAWIVDAWRDRDTTRARKRFIRLFRENGFSEGEVWGDGDGLGGSMIDEFRENGFPLIEFRGGLAAPDIMEGRHNAKERYANLISWVWFRGCEMIRRKLVNIEGIDAITVEQITSRPREDNTNGKRQAMPKKHMKAKHGLDSPDRADALLGCIACGARLTGAITEEAAAASIVRESPWAVQTVRF